VSAVFNWAGGISFSLREPYDYALNRELAIQGEIRQQRNGALAGPAQITAHPDGSVKLRIHQRAAVEAMRRQRVPRLTLWTVVGPVAIGAGDLYGILLDGACEGV
jgi:hypothetical protein